MTKSPILLLPHVPKCAGTTVERHFHEILGEPGFWSPKRRKRKLPMEFYRRKYDDTPPGPLSEVRAVSGHFIGRSIENRLTDREIWRGILLRDPRAMIISWYNFRMSRYLSLGQKTYSFDRHLEGLTANPITTFILDRWLEYTLQKRATMRLEERAALVDEALGRFQFIGDISQCDALIEEANAVLGVEGEAKPQNTFQQWQTKVEWEPVTLDGLSEKTRMSLESRVVLDDYVWRKWAMKEEIEFDGSGSINMLVNYPRRIFHQLRRRRERGA